MPNYDVHAKEHFRVINRLNKTTCPQVSIKMPPCNPNDSRLEVNTRSFLYMNERVRAFQEMYASSHSIKFNGKFGTVSS